MGIKLYDTVKDKSGKRFRVTETKNDGTGHIMATLKGINPDGSARRGMPRRVRLDVLESEYTRINLAPVEVKKIDDLRKEETKVTQVPTPSDKALEKQKEAVRALSVDEVEEALTKSTFGAIEKDLPDDVCIKDIEEENERLRADNFNLRRVIEELSDGRDGMAERNKDMEILKTECLALKDENKKCLREIDDYKKTISKMKQQHEAEVQDLKDQLGEAKAAEAAAKKAHANAVGEKNNYADALDNDSVAFEEILGLAILMERSAKSMQEMSKMLQDKTEGKV